jgi:hypothetical protein
VKNTIISIIMFLVTVSPAAVWAAEEKWSLDFEGGAVFPGYNNIQIPNNDTGTRFSLKNDLDIHKKAYYRLRLTYQLGKRHGLSILYAPLSLKADGTLNQTLAFAGTNFDSGSKVQALYRFNSYRLTYKYLLVNKPKIHFWIGFTAKIRDAEIKLETNTKRAVKANVGFVPLLHLYLDWFLGKKLGILVEVDALAAKQGRAEDVGVSMFYKIKKNITFKLGYRFVEGGANVEDVYTFAMINYAYGGVIVRF